jgi:hypothetical protein
LRCSEYPGALWPVSRIGHTLDAQPFCGVGLVAAISPLGRRIRADKHRPALGTVLGTAVLTMIYQPGIDLTTVRHGWEFIAAAASTSALIAAGLGAWWRSGDADQPMGVDDAIVVSET